MLRFRERFSFGTSAVALRRHRFYKRQLPHRPAPLSSEVGIEPPTEETETIFSKILSREIPADIIYEDTKVTFYF